jgi:hypothetical protein
MTRIKHPKNPNKTKKPTLDHHAYLVEGDRREVLPELLSFIEGEFGISAKGNPDFFCEEFEKFGIDEGRRMRQLCARAVPEGGTRIYVCALDKITREAQNAILKLFEEPTQGIHFFLALPHASQLLPTLRSRLMLLPIDSYRTGTKTGTVRASLNISTEEFIKALPHQRLKMISRITDEKNVRDADAFLSMLEDVLLQKKKDLTRGSELYLSLEEIEKVKTYLQGRSPSVKMILEHVALALPRI